MYGYNKNTEGYAAINDLVEICHTVSDMDGLTGRIGGWGDYTKMIALVILDKQYNHPREASEVTVVSMPVVCLKKL